MEEITLFGTVNYYAEHFMSLVMNRLVAHDMFSPEEYYEKLQNEIANLNEPEHVKQQYGDNLTKAYERFIETIYGVPEEIEYIS